MAAARFDTTVRASTPDAVTQRHSVFGHIEDDDGSSAHNFDRTTWVWVGNVLNHEREEDIAKLFVVRIADHDVQAHVRIVGSGTWLPVARAMTRNRLTRRAMLGAPLLQTHWTSTEFACLHHMSLVEQMLQCRACAAC